MKKHIGLILCFVFVSFLSDAQRLERMLLEQWSLDSWTNKMEQTHTYSKDNELDATTIRHWNETQNAWINHSRTTLQRDPEGKVARKKVELWDANTNEWKPSQLTVHTFDAAGNPTLSVTSKFKEGEWQNFQNEFSAYDSENQLTSKITQSWNEQTGEWRNDRMYVYEFVAVQKRYYTIYYWDNTVNNWENYKEVSYTFSSDDQLESRLDYSWLGGNWALTTTQIYELDSASNVTAINIESYNEESEEFELSNRVEYRLNSYRKIDESLTKKVIDGQLTNLQRFTYFYSEQSDISEYTGFDGSPLELFPNPTSRFIHLNFINKGQITVFDETGKEVMHIDNTEQESLTIDVSNWESGIYTILPSNGEARKFIKKKIISD